MAAAAPCGTLSASASRSGQIWREEALAAVVERLPAPATVCVRPWDVMFMKNLVPHMVRWGGVGPLGGWTARCMVGGAGAGMNSPRRRCPGAECTPVPPPFSPLPLP